MKSVSKYILLTLLALTAAASINADSGGRLKILFEAGNSFYEAKQFDSAITNYHLALNQGVESANLYFNLGNSYFKKGDLGRAILYYLKANKLDPADDDIKSNLEFARQFTTVPMEGVTLNPINSFLNNIVESYRLDTMAWLTTVIFIILITFLIIIYGFGWSNPLIRVGVVTVGVILIIISGLTTFKYQTDYLKPRAVITSEDSVIFTGPTLSADVELEGAPGLVVEIIDEAGEFYNILLENKRQGWISKNLVEII